MNNFWYIKMCFRVVKRKMTETNAKIRKYVNTIKCIIFRKNFKKIIMTSIVILWYWKYFHKIRTVKMKGIFFHPFDIAVLAEPWELKKTSMCQLWHVGRLRVNVGSLLWNYIYLKFNFSYNSHVIIILEYIIYYKFNI